MFDAVVNLFSCPHIGIFKVFRDVDLPGPFQGTLFPATPIPIIVEVILPGTSSEDLISGFGPREFVLDFTHWQSQFLLGRKEDLL